MFTLPKPRYKQQHTAEDVLLLGFEPHVVGKLHRVMASFHTTNHLQRGYAPFDGHSAHFHGWHSIFRFLMHEADLGKVMSGVETAPAALTASASEEDITAHAVSVDTFKEKNCKLYALEYF